jgi:DNA segregation ATPase FtsK/SpoIIIE, S-DNA-T family
MAKKKNTTAKEKVKAIKKTGQRSQSARPFHIIATLFQFIVVFAVLATLFLLRQAIINGIEAIFNFFGLGLVFIAAAFITIVVLICRRNFRTLFFRWNWWLGGIAVFMSLWGALAFWNLGGEIGRGIAGFPARGFISFLRLLALAVIGIIFIFPKFSFQGLLGIIGLFKSARVQKEPVRPSFSEELRKLRKNIQPMPEMKDKLVAKTELSKPEIATQEEDDEEESLEEPAVSSSKPDARQVAGDVWKKYGQASGLTVVDGWKLPPVDILDVSPEIEFSEADNLQRSKLIEDALASYGVDAKVVQINAGPTVTQFGVEPGWDRKYKEVKEKDKDGNLVISMAEVSKTRIKVDRITSLSNDMALALAAPSIRIEAPVPGKSIVGIEVPNKISDMVSLRGVVETSVFQKQLSKAKMAIALGKGAGGEAVAADLTKMPHLLIAGATGSGKTVCLNTIVCCLLMHNTPNDVRFIMVDPKRVELTPYNSIPHLATPVIVDTSKALSALRWLAQEMDERYKKMAAASARHIEGYNKNRKGADKMPYLVLMIDELADLMMSGFDEVETTLCRLAQLARATGIHLVVATQRPSVDVVTGLIKANFPTRISFAVTSQVDSRTILDGAGAEKLLGKGDMLFMPTEAAKPKRLQGCFLSDPEIERLVYFWASQKKDEPDNLKMETLVATTPTGTIGGYPIDPLMEQAKELAKDSQMSTSFLQRKLHIGYPRAARLMEQLEEVLKIKAKEEQDEGPEEGN